jgi:hypothetical protein
MKFIISKHDALEILIRTITNLIANVSRTFSSPIQKAADRLIATDPLKLKKFQEWTYHTRHSRPRSDHLSIKVFGRLGRCAIRSGTRSTLAHFGQSPDAENRPEAALAATPAIQRYRPRIGGARLGISLHRNPWIGNGNERATGRNSVQTLGAH